MKQRLIGAAVLISLIVIFVPMLLRGPVENRVVEVPVEIPPKPFEVVGKKRPDQSAEKIVHTIPEPSGRRPVVTEEKPASRKMAQKITTPAVSASKPAPKKPAQKPKQSVRKPLQTAAKKQEKPVLITESKKNIVELAWVVQVGSFSSSKNALALRDKLRKKGYRTFVESIKTSSGKMYRVRVGPELDKVKVDAMQEKLKQKEKLPGKIYKHGS
ncbi:MAG: hypothetical protein D6B28_03575 [Gammaproteobacteria bacterium]|nr:MAG: hypothetical protein D6B28_03575 [Gammaproteobacteria bacterium]